MAIAKAAALPATAAIRHARSSRFVIDDPHVLEIDLDADRTLDLGDLGITER
jgi:hypothetical protein